MRSLLIILTMLRNCAADLDCMHLDSNFLEHLIEFFAVQGSNELFEDFWMGKTVMKENC